MSRRWRVVRHPLLRVGREFKAEAKAVIRSRPPQLDYRLQGTSPALLKARDATTKRTIRRDPRYFSELTQGHSPSCHVDLFCPTWPVLGLLVLESRKGD